MRSHPHIGLATVICLLDGEIMHRDSLGTVQAIQPGAVNRMTAGRGIVHSERTMAELRLMETRLCDFQPAGADRAGQGRLARWAL